ncbi:winged helix-turn-helix transcriptional regulator [Pigmentiphaga litoralis]|uniref:DNA-binding HxlR family transcriptional regulator n=1 Tax=Pigmentiphaga litoralis TaxID=516702 RepID=A0A7Y9IZQ3_9BURK|nr:helix-turn-helix domain-containing protein [Pigmentiphaga litoralis]NYE27013.1 DNA-binding HxlR family transcriptional regulator [Pigmentiphaga litoralis]NYE86126.1 DNA-binding HxlR family transcriptional regulator [Pigmentiphaga litoralis]
MTSSTQLPVESTPASLAAPPALSLSDKMQRGDVMAAECPSRQVLQHLTSRWGVLVLITLLQGTQRFSQLRRKIGGINERMLAQTLQWLEADAMVHRRSFNTVPPHVEYTLTPLGAEAAEKVRDLVDWLETHMPDIAEAGQAGRPSGASDKAA